MNISDPNPEDVTLQQVAVRAGCTVKTIRRAVQSGHLSRRYVMSARGPQLVFTPEEVERWLAERPERHRSRHHSGPDAEPATEDWSALIRRIGQLQAVLSENRATIAELNTKLRDQERVVSDARSIISALSDRLSMLEARVPEAHPTGATAADDAQPAGPTNAKGRRHAARSGAR